MSGNTRITALLFFLLVTSIGCKKNLNATSTGKTLNDFAAGATTAGFNKCGIDAAEPNHLSESLRIVADPNVVNGEQLVSEYEEDIKQYFEGLPKYYATAYIEKLKGVVMLTDSDGFNKMCAKNKDLTPARANDISACYGYTGKAGETQLAVIHRIDTSSSASKIQNEDKIRHGGVRAFGMVFSQFMAHNDIETDAAKLKAGINLRLESEDVSDAVRNLKMELATNFLADVVGSETYDIKTFSPILGSDLSGLSQQVKGYAKGVDLKKFWDATNIPAPARQQFFDYVFAEAFDSAYCSGATASAAKVSFPKTFSDYKQPTSVFSRLEKAVQTHSDRVLSYAIAHSSQQDSVGSSLTEGFSLQSSSNCPCCNGQNCVGGCSCPKCQMASSGFSYANPPPYNGNSQNNYAGDGGAGQLFNFVSMLGLFPRV